ncbi:MAG: TolC family protein [Limisphaerales bacterium]
MVILTALLGVMAVLSGCASSQDGRHDQPAAPPAASQPWNSSDYRESSSVSTTNADFAHQLGIPVVPDPDKTYDLVSLIALAQEANPQTRIAWEQARAQAAQLGIADSDWYPALAFMVSGGYANEVDATPSGGLSTYGPSVLPELTLQWTLLDFGRRKAKIDSAVQTLLQSNFQFNRTHQQVAYTVQTSYYTYDASCATVDAMLAALKSAQAVEEAAQARLDSGLATQPDLLLARQDRVLAEYNLRSAQRSVTDAQSALAEAVGIAPTMPLKVAPMSTLPLPAELTNSVEHTIDRALASRPDLAAQLAALRASEANVSKAKAAYLPEIGLSGSVGQSYSRFDAYTGGKTTGPFDYDDTIYGINLTLSWDIFDGFLRRNKLREAQAQRSQTAAQLSALQLKAMREVWKSYVDVKTALVQYEAAQALLAASQDSYDANITKYENGLGTLIDLLAAERELAHARTSIVESRAELLDAAAALAFAMGDSNAAQAKKTPVTGQTKNNP